MNKKLKKKMILVISILLCLFFTVTSYAAAVTEPTGFSAVFEITGDKAECKPGDIITFTIKLKDMKNSAIDKLLVANGLIEYDSNFFEPEVNKNSPEINLNKKSGENDSKVVIEFLANTSGTGIGDVFGTISLQVKSNAKGASNVKFTNLMTTDNMEEITLPDQAIDVTIKEEVPENPNPGPEEPGTKPENPNPGPEEPETKPENPNPEPEEPGTKPENPNPEPEKPETKLFKVYGTIWLDLNKNNKKDNTDIAAQGLTLKLYDVNNKTYYKNAENIEMTATTNTNGEYSFENVGKGKYRVTIENAEKINEILPNYKIPTEKIIIDGKETEKVVTPELNVQNSNMKHDVSISKNINIQEDLKPQKPENNIPEKDDTKAETIIPHAGLTSVISIAIIALLIVGVVLFRKNQKYKDI